MPWQEGKRERPDGLRTLQQRIEQVKVPISAKLLHVSFCTRSVTLLLWSQVEINKLDEEHKKLKKESRELDAQINEVEEERTHSPLVNAVAPTRLIACIALRVVLS